MSNTLPNVPGGEFSNTGEGWRQKTIRKISAAAVAGVMPLAASGCTTEAVSQVIIVEASCIHPGTGEPTRPVITNILDRERFSSMSDLVTGTCPNEAKLGSLRYTIVREEDYNQNILGPHKIAVHSRGASEDRAVINLSAKKDTDNEFILVMDPRGEITSVEQGTDTPPQGLGQ